MIANSLASALWPLDNLCKAPIVKGLRKLAVMEGSFNSTVHHHRLVSCIIRFLEARLRNNLAAVPQFVHKFVLVQQ